MSTPSTRQTDESKAERQTRLRRGLQIPVALPVQPLEPHSAESLDDLRLDLARATAGLDAVAAMIERDDLAMAAGDPVLVGEARWRIDTLRAAGERIHDAIARLDHEAERCGRSPAGATLAGQEG